MKTTSGKTKPAAPRGKRLIKIMPLVPKHRGVTAQFESTSLKAALTEFFERNWQDKGWKMKIVGNTAQIYKGDAVHVYRALESYQRP